MGLQIQIPRTYDSRVFNSLYTHVSNNNCEIIINISIKESFRRRAPVQDQYPRPAQQRGAYLVQFIAANVSIGFFFLQIYISRCSRMGYYYFIVYCILLSTNTHTTCLGRVYDGIFFFFISVE